MDESIITINATNIVTIWIVALVGFVVFGLLSQMVKKRAMPQQTNPA